jgi:hypothetical protein
MSSCSRRGMSIGKHRCYSPRPLASTPQIILWILLSASQITRNHSCVPNSQINTIVSSRDFGSPKLRLLIPTRGENEIVSIAQRISLWCSLIWSQHCLLTTFANIAANWRHISAAALPSRYLQFGIPVWDRAVTQITWTTRIVLLAQSPPCLRPMVRSTCPHEFVQTLQHY